MKILFLDFDGVMDSESYIQILKKQGKPLKDKYGTIFDPICVKNLKHITDQTGASIVVTSLWKRIMSYGDIVELWGYRELPGFVAGVTPNLGKSLNRGDEIDAWLEECRTDIQYVIIDDLRAKFFKEHQLPRLLKVDPIGGLDEDTAERAIEILNSDIK